LPLKYCVRCVLPDSKPDLHFNSEGVCAACQAYEYRTDVDWDARREEFLAIVDEYRDTTNSSWDCIVPVSGGKDSTFQVIKMLELGVRPLAVTATTCDLTDVGLENIENIRNLGVDHITFSPNPVVRRKLNRIGLTEVGDISWPEHVGIFTIPVRAAVQFNIPLIIWGENSQNEYGGPEAATTSRTLDRRWLEEFGGLLGMRVSDLAETQGLLAGDLAPYTYPSGGDLDRVGVRGLFLGQFFPWDGMTNALIAQAAGFKTTGSVVEGSMVDYENIDNYQVGIHDYFKFLKFGFGRATDIASLHVRRGRLTRKQAVDIIRRRDGKFPWTYLGKPLADILKPIEVTVDEFIAICDRFTNESIFVTKKDGSLLRDRDGNLTKHSYDNASLSQP
jgi:N-acetyl sugar amidotransferase